METHSDKTSILIVDDRDDKLLSLRSVLEDLDENLVCVKSGNEALRQLLRQDFAVILLDVNMPGMDGFETAALIRQRLRSETTPIIFISAMNDAETHVARGYSLGAVDYILSPVIPEILRAKVAVFVDLFRKTEKVKRQAEDHARFVQEQAARVEAEAAQDRLAFLAEAGNVLARSLDYQQIFENLAGLLVPRLADFCIIDHMNEQGNLHHVATTHRDPDQEPVLNQLRYSGHDSVHQAALRVFQSRRSELKNHMDAQSIRELFPAEERDQVKSLDPTCYVAVPIIARNSIIGILTLVRTRGSKPYSPIELSLAEELSQRAALALDNAALYQAARRAREEAEAANNAKDRFLAMLSHELRTPLTPVITSILNLEADSSLQPQTRQALLVMRRNVELEARLIDDLLDLTRVGSGQIRLSREIVNAHSLLENAVEICQPDIAAKALTLEQDLRAADVFVEADPARLQQIFWNLIRNATKFTESGSIRLHTHSEDGRFYIEVSDTGIGMDSELIERIFLPFEQGERGLFGGLGLGLTITKALVDLHEGGIQVESEGKGHGATFRVNFPSSAAPSVQAETPSITEADERFPLRILLVEDNSDTNQALTMLLEMRGYSVISALNVRSARELAEQNEVDVLISDLGLPDGTADEAMQIVAARYSAIGIALSGYGMEEDIERSKQYGFSHHLVKPVDVARLITILGQLAQKAA